MTSPAVPAASSIADLTARLPSATTVIAVTDDGADPRFGPVRALAGQAASRIGGTALFCLAEVRGDVPFRARPRLFLPLTATAGRPHTGTRRRDLLVEEARAIAAPGLSVGVWLPTRQGASGVAEAVTATRATLVLVPARERRRGRLDRTLEYLAARVPAPVVAVALDGTWAPVSALGARDDDWRKRAGRLVQPVALPTPAR